jgi:hypothetical protein
MEEGATGATDEELPWTSIGAFLVNNLASKVVLAMFPAGRPPMKLKQDRRTNRPPQAGTDGQPTRRRSKGRRSKRASPRWRSEFSEAMEEDGDRAKLNVAARKQIVGGTHGLKFDTATEPSLAPPGALRL